jgi:hypothetical protein
MMVLGVIYPVGAIVEGAIAHVVGIRAVTEASGVLLFLVILAIGLWHRQLFASLEGLGPRATAGPAGDGLAPAGALDDPTVSTTP